MSKKRKKLKKKNPMAKLLSSPMLRNKIVKNKKKIYNRKNFKLENEQKVLIIKFLNGQEL